MIILVIYCKILILIIKNWNLIHVLILNIQIFLLIFSYFSFTARSSIFFLWFHNYFFIIFANKRHFLYLFLLYHFWEIIIHLFFEINNKFLFPINLFTVKILFLCLHIWAYIEIYFDNLYIRKWSLTIFPFQLTIFWVCSV